jgi:hypothetical protein
VATSEVLRSPYEEPGACPPDVLQDAALSSSSSLPVAHTTQHQQQQLDGAEVAPPALLPPAGSTHHQQQHSASVLTGALPLEALTALQLAKLTTKHQSFLLQALRDQLQRSASQQPRVPMRLQVHDRGTWSFKGLSGAHPVVLLLPSRLAGRLAHTQAKRSSKAVCVAPPAPQALLHELWIEVVNMDTLLLDPEALLAAGGASAQQQGHGLHHHAAA